MHKAFPLLFHPASAPNPSSRFGPAAEVKGRLQLQALQRLSGLVKALPLLFHPASTPRNSENFSSSNRSKERFLVGASSFRVSNQSSPLLFHPASAPNPSSRFGPAAEVKGRLQLQALQRLSGLVKALQPLFHPASTPRNSENFSSSDRSKERFLVGASSFRVSNQSSPLLFSLFFKDVG